MSRLVCLLLISAVVVSSTVWSEVGDALPTGTTPLASTFAQNTKLATGGTEVYLESISGTLSNERDVDTYTFATKGLSSGSVTISLTAATYSDKVGGNDPALFVFRVDAQGSFTALVASRVSRNSAGSAFPAVTLSNPANGRYMVAITSYDSVPTKSATGIGMNLWDPKHQTTLSNTAPGWGASSPYTLGGWSAPRAGSPSKSPVTYSMLFSFTNLAGALVFGDPHFVGYSGQHFDFPGRAGRAYQLYSDETVAVNVEMAEWVGPVQKVAPNSTVMVAVGVFIGPHFVYTSTFNRAENATSMEVDGNRVTLVDGHPVEFECIRIESHRLGVSIAFHDYVVQVSWHHRAYSTHSFLDVEVDVPDRILDGVARGGLLGQTIAAQQPILEESSFMTSALRELDAKTNRFSPRSTYCL